MKNVIAITYADFGNRTRKDILRIHYKKEAIYPFLKKFVSIYGKGSNRVWTVETETASIIFDSLKQDI